jgi:hypothetical protein
MHDPSGTVIVTSISPRNTAYQVDAMSSWEALGAPLYSFNGLDERDIVASQIPFPVIAVPRTAAERFRKPLIYIDSFLEYFLESSYTQLIIVNSDIFLSQPSRLVEILRTTDFDLLFGRRLDVDSVEATTGEFFDGFDYFVLTRAAAERYPRSNFCMGAPWWDHWMPLVQLAHRTKVFMCEEPLVLHLKHPGQWGLDTQIPLASELAGFLLDLFEAQKESYGGSPHKNPLAGLASLFALYFKVTRSFYDHHYYRAQEYEDETNRCLVHEICWRMPQVVLHYIFSATPRAGKDFVGHDKEIPLGFK